MTEIASDAAPLAVEIEALRRRLQTALRNADQPVSIGGSEAMAVVRASVVERVDHGR